MKLLKIAVIASLALLAGCGPKAVDSFVGEDAKVSVYNQKCKNQDVLAIATLMGAPQQDLEKMATAKVEITKGEDKGKKIDACVFYVDQDTVIVVDEQSHAGYIKRKGSKTKIEDGPSKGLIGVRG